MNVPNIIENMKNSLNTNAYLKFLKPIEILNFFKEDLLALKTAGIKMKTVEKLFKEYMGIEIKYHTLTYWYKKHSNTVKSKNDEVKEMINKNKNISPEELLNLKK